MANYEITITSEFDQVHHLGKLVRDVCAGSMSEEDVAAVELSVVEAANNIVEHAYQEKTGQPVKLEIMEAGSEIVFILTDYGISMPEGLLEKESNVFDFDPEDIENLPEGGMGIDILKQVMDKIEYLEDGGANRLRLTKRIS